MLSTSWGFLVTAAIISLASGFVGTLAAAVAIGAVYWLGSPALALVVN